MDCADQCTMPWQGRMVSYRTSSCTPPSFCSSSLGFRSDLLLGDFCWVLQPGLPVVLCKDMSKQLVELFKLFKCLIPVETCLDALENPIRAFACTFKHLNTFKNAFFDHLGIEGQSFHRICAPNSLAAPERNLWFCLCCANVPCHLPLSLHHLCCSLGKDSK